MCALRMTVRTSVKKAKAYLVSRRILSCSARLYGATQERSHGFLPHFEQDTAISRCNLKNGIFRAASALFSRHKVGSAGVITLEPEISRNHRRNPMPRTVWNRFFIGMALITSIALLIWIAGASAVAQNTYTGEWTATVSTKENSKIHLNLERKSSKHGRSSQVARHPP